MFLHKINKKIVDFADHPKALWFFFLFAFLSGSLVPLPIDPLFLVLIMQQKKQTFWLIFLGALGVTLGGLCMYFIGTALYATLVSWLIKIYNWETSFRFLSQQIHQYGGWLIIIKTFTPIPYKLLALVAGIAHLPLSIFIGASLAGRLLRLSIEGAIFAFISDPLKELLQKYLSLGLGLFFLAMLILTFLMPAFVKL